MSDALEEGINRARSRTRSALSDHLTPLNLLRTFPEEHRLFAEIGLAPVVSRDTDGKLPYYSWLDPPSPLSAPRIATSVGARPYV